MKKILLISLGLITFSTSFANIEDCGLAGANKNKADITKYCTPYLKNEKYPEATGILATATSNDKEALDYSLWIDSYYSKNKPKNENEYDGYTSIVDLIGNIYYFGQGGVPVDKTKGLEYITKSANLGNDIAQNQLGDFYNSTGGDPDLNASQSYKWYTLAIANGSDAAKNSGLMSDIDSVTKQAPYCIAMGEQMVAQAYIDGTAGLSKDNSKAKEYLNDAIALYKDNKLTKDALEYCPEGADKLNLDSAEKELKGL